MEYLVRFVQHHESFRKEEIKALAVLADINIEWIYYSEVVRRYVPVAYPVYCCSPIPYPVFRLIQFLLSDTFSSLRFQSSVSTARPQPSIRPLNRWHAS